MDSGWYYILDPKKPVGRSWTEMAYSVFEGTRSSIIVYPKGSCFGSFWKYSGIEGTQVSIMEHVNLRMI